ncbi:MULTISPECIES: hemolysin family protein [unclassified Bartonella]|uniref:hemolysin family protein n=1 Tax=unclassified Bartonella TaxID=2645622 RepID=UPI000999095F|nr:MULTISPECIES: hemolysin family protein [unclassified Bartonella]AQX22400.1 CBS domain-containing protein [Bartonella sp. 11B]AQX24317.1 CBS domain-containing protein [Bartonella sp. 114]AQX24849.1 CBS domain-containing protein [Bartonella sp. Coyote22sub2]
MADKINTKNNTQISSNPEEYSLQKTSYTKKNSLLSSLFSFLRRRNHTSLRDGLTNVLATDNEKGTTLFSPEERTMLHNILCLREARVDNIMIPRSEIEALEINTPLGEALKFFAKIGHSRIPVYAETLDDPRGMIHIHDILNYITSFITSSTRNEQKYDSLQLNHKDLQHPIGELDLIRTVLFVPRSMLASKLLTRMQTTRTQMALVIDEYGGTDGLVSMEDIVELVVGDIEDEHDNIDNAIIRQPDNKWLVDAKTELKDLEKALGPDFVVGEYGDEVDTIGGLIFSILDRIPSKGEIIETVPGYRFRILEADKRRIKRLCIFRISENENLKAQQSYKDS